MRRMALAAAVLSGLAPSGCSTIGPVAGTLPGTSGSSYAAGRATQPFAYPPEAMRSAVLAAMDDLRISSVRQARDNGSFLYNGTTADGRGVTVAVRPHQGTARVSVRVGWFGDEPLSKLLMDRIGIRLGTLPPSAIPVEPPSIPASNPYFSREAIPDEVMLHDQADAIYRDSPVP